MSNQEMQSQLDNMKELYVYFPHPYLLFQMNVIRKQISIQNKKRKIAQTQIAQTQIAQTLSTNMLLPRRVKVVRKL